MDDPILLDDVAHDAHVETSAVVTSNRRNVVAVLLAAGFTVVAVAALMRPSPQSNPIALPSTTIDETVGDAEGTPVAPPEWFDLIAASLDVEPVAIEISSEAGSLAWGRLRAEAGLLVQSAGLNDGQPSLLVQDSEGRHLTATLADDGTWVGVPVDRPAGSRLQMVGNGLLVAVNRDRAASVSLDGATWTGLKAIDGAAWTGERLGGVAVVGYETLSRRGLFFVDPDAEDVVTELDVSLPSGRGMRIAHDGSQWLVAAPSDDGPQFFRSQDGRTFEPVTPFTQAPAMGADGTFASANPPVLAQGVDLFRLITTGQAIEIANYPGLTLTEAASRGRLTAVVGVPVDDAEVAPDLPEVITVRDTEGVGARLEFVLDTSEWRFYTPTAIAPSLEFYVSGPSSLRDAGVTLNEREDGTTEIQVVHLASGVALFRFSLDEVNAQLDGLNLLDGSVTPELGMPSLSWSLDDGQSWIHLPLSTFPIDSVVPSVLIGRQHLMLVPNDPRRPILLGTRPT